MACQQNQTSEAEVNSAEKELPLAAEPKKELTQAEALLAGAVHAHGGVKYDEAHFGFTFREKKYTFHNKGKAYEYSVSSIQEDQELIDVLANNSFKRTLNGVEVELNPEDQGKYSEALNSVIYFATLPHKLQDPAVKLSYNGTVSIAGKMYEILEVSFGQEGGGNDFDDEYLYWINAETHTMDYFAYNYTVNDGGVRFRSAYNPRRVGGVLFQDYVNYEAPLGTPLANLPALFEKEELKKLSVIETQNVKNLTN